MYTITIKNYYQNGVLNKNETVLYTVPIQPGQEENVLTDPTVSGEMGKTGTFEFTIYPNHPYYHAIAQMRTIMRVDYDGDTIFRGRILTIDNTMAGVKKVHCEGDMAFLLDSIQMNSIEAERPRITLHDYIAQLLVFHNQQMMESGETDKCIYPGYIPGAYPEAFIGPQQIPNETDQFGSDGIEQTMSALETLEKRFGGFFRTRYSDETKLTYLDWYRLWFRRDIENGQPIAITQNIIDAQSNSEVDNIFTALIPIGSSEGKDVFISGYRTDIHGDNNRILVPQITQIYSESELSFGYMSKAIYEQAIDQYGIIYKTQKFQNADTPEKLWNYAWDWVKNNYVGGITSYDLTAVDMHHVDHHVIKYLVGDCVVLSIHSDMASVGERNPNHNTTIVHRTILSAKYDLHHPEKNNYTAGIPSDILNVEYGTKSTSKSTSGSGKGAGSKGGGGDRDRDKIGGDSELTERSLNELAWNYVISAEYNNDLYHQLLREDPTGERAAAAERASHVRLMERIRGQEILEDGSSAERYYGIGTSMILDAQLGALTFLQPVVEFLGFDQAGQQMTNLRARTSLEIDGYNGYLSMRGLPSYRDTEGAASTPIGGLWDGIRRNVAEELLNDPLNAFNVQADTRGAIMRFLEGETNADATPTATVNGNAGIVGSVFNVLGADGSGDIANATTLLNGLGNGGTGSMDLGRQAGQWLIRMNEPLQYTVDGTTYTLPSGTIDATDYSLLRDAYGNEIPSFKTKIAVMNKAIIERATIKQLEAVEGNIDTLTSRVGHIEDLTADYATFRNMFSAEGGITTLSVNTIRNCTNIQFRNSPIKYHYVKDINNNTIQVLGKST